MDTKQLKVLDNLGLEGGCCCCVAAGGKRIQSLGYLLIFEVSNLGESNDDCSDKSYDLQEFLDYSGGLLPILGYPF